MKYTTSASGYYNDVANKMEIAQRQLDTLNKMTGGVKYDAEKIRYDLIPADAMEALANILTFGAKKYGDRNWEKGMEWGRLFRAALGHLWDWHRKRGNDPETGKSHL